MLYFAQPSYTNALYGIFLEKAWAKVNGNYEFIEGGWETEAIRFISGAPSATFHPSSGTAMSDWYAISNGTISNSVMVGAVGSSSTINLITGHAYSIIGTLTAKFTNGTVVYLYHIRNPWGTDAGFGGSWNDSSPYWSLVGNGLTLSTPTAYVNNINDGDFYVELNEFNTNFP